MKINTKQNSGIELDDPLNSFCINQNLKSIIK